MTIHIDAQLAWWLGGGIYLVLGLFVGIPILALAFSDWRIPNVWGAHLAAFLIGWVLWLPLIFFRIIITLLDPESWR